MRVPVQLLLRLTWEGSVYLHRVVFVAVQVPRRGRPLAQFLGRSRGDWPGRFAASCGKVRHGIQRTN
jgi:hypothetical protein